MFRSAILFMVAICCVTMFSGCTTYDSKKLDSRVIDFELSSLPLKHLSKDFDFEEYKHIDSNEDYIVYMVDSKACTPCSNEIIDFHRFLKKNEYNFKEAVLIVDDNKERAKRFIATSEINNKHFLVEPNDVKELLNFGENENVGRQILFLSQNLEKIYFRAYLVSKKPTSHNYKLFLVNKALEYRIEMLTKSE